MAGTHLRGPDSQYNITPAAGLLGEGGEVIGFCSWREGLVLRPERADQICGIPDLAGSGLRLAWLLDQLASLPGYDPGRCGERIATLSPRH